MVHEDQTQNESNNAFIPLPITDQIRVAQIIGSALRTLGYADLSLQLDLLQISVRQHDSEKKLTHTYQYEYDIQLSWTPIKDGIELCVTVTERKRTWQIGQCHQRSQDILAAVQRQAQRYLDVSKHRKRNTLHGDARFAELEELREAGFLEPPAGDRLLIGKSEESQITIPAAESHRHALICGPTGSGKTWSIFVPNLIFRTNTSAIVTEARSGSETGHLFSATAGYRASQGHKVFYFDPDDKSSTRINPVELCIDPYTASHMASLIMQNTSLRTHMGDQIWETSERLLLTALLLDACARKKHLGSIRWLLREGPIGMGRLLLESPAQVARLEYHSFLNNSLEGFRAGVVAGLMQRLNLWIIPEIVALTETTDFTANDLIDNLFTFYFCTPSHKPELEPLMSLVFNFVLNIPLENSRKHPLTLFLDEFVNYGRIPAMSRKLTMIRHSEIGAVLGIQDYLQLDELYGRNQAQILFGQPASRIFFPPNDIRTAKEISELLGKTTAEELFINGRCEVSTKAFPRWLMTTEEVLGADPTTMVARLPKLRFPVQLKRIDRKIYLDKTKLMLPSRPEHPVEDRHLGLDEIVAKGWLKEGAKQQEKWSKMSLQDRKQAFKQEKGKEFQESPKVAPSADNNKDTREVNKKKTRLTAQYLDRYSAKDR